MIRIVSLLPSATEIICGLGLREQLVGVTHECEYPDGVAKLPKVTRTLIPHDATSGEIDAMVREQLKTKAALYSLDLAVLTSLQPDLIVTQALCDVCAVAEREVKAAACALSRTPRVINLEPSCLADVLQSIAEVGAAANIPAQTKTYIADLQRRIAVVARRSESILPSNRPSVILLEWIDPPFSAGHWSPELVALAGGREAMGQAGQRSVTMSWDQIVEIDPEAMVIACCGFSVARTLEDIPILRSSPGWEKLRCVESRQVFVVNGSDYFSRPGPRLVDSLEILAHALHPSVHRLPPGLTAAQRVEK